MMLATNHRRRDVTLTHVAVTQAYYHDDKKDGDGEGNLHHIESQSLMIYISVIRTCTLIR